MSRQLPFRVLKILLIDRGRCSRQLADPPRQHQHHGASEFLLHHPWLHQLTRSARQLESKIGLINVYCRPDCLPAAGPRADGTGTLGLALLRGGETVAFEPPAEGEEQGGRGWGDADRRGGARL